MNYKMTSLSTHIELNPDQPPIGSVIWLHGLGANGNDFVPVVSELNLPNSCPLRFIFPNAPRRAVTINSGYIMPAWFDIYSLQSEHPLDKKGIADSVQLLNDYIEKEKALQITPNKVILAGFSQGAAIALTAGLLHKEKLAGMMGLSGYLPNANQVIAQSSNSNTPVFIGHGTQDEILPAILGEKVASLLKEHGFPVLFREYHMPHSVSVDEIADIRGWILNLFNVAEA